MPPHKKRNDFVLVVDISSDERFIRGTLDKLFVYKSLEQRGINKYESNDLYRLVLLNYPHPSTDGQHFLLVEEVAQVMTDNSVFATLDQHLEVYRSCDAPSECSWIKALEYAGSMVAGSARDAWIQTAYLIFISDFKNMPEDDTVKQMPCLRFLKQADVRFIAIINEDIKYVVSSSVESSEDAIDVMEGITITKMNAQMEQMCRLVRSIGGVIASPKYFLDFVVAFEVPAPKQEWKTELTFGNYTFPTISRKIIESCGNGLKKEGPAETSWEYYRMQDVDIGADVGADAADDLGERVASDEVFEVSMYHGQTVIITADVKKSFKTPGAAAFRIIGFVDKSQLSQLYFGGEDTHIVTADQANERATHFHEFAKVLYEEDLYALVVRVYNAGTAGRLFVLCPQPENYFIMCDMCEKMRAVVEATPAKEAVDESVLSTGMLALRRHLMERGAPGSSLFGPTATLSLSQKAVIDKVRRTIGYNTDNYEREELVRAHDIAEVGALFQENAKPAEEQMECDKDWDEDGW